MVDPCHKKEKAVLASLLSPMGRDTTPDEVAGLISFLASKESGMITGSCFILKSSFLFDMTDVLL